MEKQRAGTVSRGCRRGFPLFLCQCESMNLSPRFRLYERMHLRDILMLMEERSLSLHEALDTVYNSETYAKLTDPATGLYFQSPVYIYSYLDKELATVKMWDAIIF